MAFVRINATIPGKILKQIDEYANEMQEDRSTAIRQLVAKALLEEKRKRIAKAFATHRLSVREAAEELGVDYWDLQEMLEKEGIPATNLTETEIEQRKKTVKKLAR